MKKKKKRKKNVTTSLSLCILNGITVETETGRGESGVGIESGVDERCHWVNGYAQIMELVYIPKEQAHNSPCYVIISFDSITSPLKSNDDENLANSSTLCV